MNNCWHACIRYNYNCHSKLKVVRDTTKQKKHNQTRNTLCVRPIVVEKHIL